MQIKTTCDHFTLIRMAVITSIQITNVGDYMEKIEPFYTVSGNVYWCNQNGKLYVIVQKTELVVPYDP